MVGSALVQLVTNLVVAICVLLTEISGVGAMGTPKNTGLSFSFCTNPVVAN